MKCISFEKKRPEQLRERFLERILFVSWRIFIYRAVFFKLSLQPITQPLTYLSLLSLSYSHTSVFPSPPVDYPLLQSTSPLPTPLFNQLITHLTSAIHQLPLPSTLISQLFTYQHVLSLLSSANELLNSLLSFPFPRILPATFRPRLTYPSITVHMQLRLGGREDFKVLTSSRQ